MAAQPPKTVLITGCSEGGIGESLACQFHARGLRVFATALDLKEVEGLKAMGITVLSLDITDSDSIVKVVASVSKATGGTLDFLVNNAGIGYSQPLLDVDIRVAKKLFEINVFGLVEMTQKCAPLLIKSKGTIINQASIAAIVSAPFQGIYNASKAAVLSIGDTLRLEMHPFDVKVITLITGVIRTKFFDNMPPTRLPAASLYAPIDAQLQKFVKGGELGKAMGADVYAAAVVANALGPAPKSRFWKGPRTSSVWLVSFLWHTFLDKMFLKASALDKLK